LRASGGLEDVVGDEGVAVAVAPNGEFLTEMDVSVSLDPTVSSPLSRMTGSPGWTTFR